MSLPPTSVHSGRVVVLSASIGDGHNRAARELARRLTARGQDVDVLDFLELLPLKLGSLLRRIYALQLSICPRSYGSLYAGLEDGSHAISVVRWMLSLGRRRFLKALQGCSGVVVTYPLAGQVLGKLRSQSKLEVPLWIYLTDFSVHRLWVVPEADMHLVLHQVVADQVHALSVFAKVRVSGSLVSPAFTRRPADKEPKHELRSSLGLPLKQPIALLVAGSWGVGKVVQTAQEILASGRAIPVVMCGRNAKLITDIKRRGLGIAIGWTNAMHDYMNAADVLVHNAGGMSSLEGLASGLPVLSMNCLPGHGQANAAAMESAGLARHVDTTLGFAAIFEQVLDKPVIAPRSLFGDDPSDDVCDFLERDARAKPLHTQPVQPSRGMRRKVAVGALGVTLIAVFAVSPIGVAVAKPIYRSHPNLTPHPSFRHW